MATPKVLIIGGGISGLCLAHGLKKHQIPFHVYEKDRSQAFRAQGYRIRIGGQAVDALKYLLDDATMALFELTCADMRLGPIPEIDAETGRVSDGVAPARPSNGGGKGPQGLGKAYTVDRTLFRQLLVRKLGSEHVTYGKALTGYELSAEGVTARFNDGSSASGTLLVGADGARSAVRKQYLPSLEIVDTGGRCIYGKTPMDAALFEEMTPSVMVGMCAIKDRSRDEIMTMILEPTTFPNRRQVEAEGFACPEDYMYWVLVSRPNAMGFSEDELPNLSLEESEQRAIEVTKHWHPSVRTIISHQQKFETSMLSISSVKPDFGTWEPSEFVTLIGDAVHLMGPTAGSGAITALRDAHLLCRLLASEGQSKSTIGEYERQMREYAEKTVELSWMAGKNIFGMRGHNERNIGEVMMEVRERRGK